MVVLETQLEKVKQKKMSPAMKEMDDLKKEVIVSLVKV